MAKREWYINMLDKKHFERGLRMVGWTCEGAKAAQRIVDDYKAQDKMNGIPDGQIIYEIVRG